MLSPIGSFIRDSTYNSDEPMSNAHYASLYANEVGYESYEQSTAEDHDDAINSAAGAAALLLSEKLLLQDQLDEIDDAAIPSSSPPRRHFLKSDGLRKLFKAEAEFPSEHEDVKPSVEELYDYMQQSNQAINRRPRKVLENHRYSRHSAVLHQQGGGVPAAHVGGSTLGSTHPHQRGSSGLRRSVNGYCSEQRIVKQGDSGSYYVEGAVGNNRHGAVHTSENNKHGVVHASENPSAHDERVATEDYIELSHPLSNQSAEDLNPLLTDRGRTNVYNRRGAIMKGSTRDSEGGAGQVGASSVGGEGRLKGGRLSGSEKRNSYPEESSSRVDECSILDNSESVIGGETFTNMTEGVKANGRCLRGIGEGEERGEDEVEDCEGDGYRDMIIDRLVKEAHIYRCSPCNILFPDYAMYVLHLGCHGNDTIYQCHFCRERLRDKYEFITHFITCPHQLMSL